MKFRGKKDSIEVIQDLLKDDQSNAKFTAIITGSSSGIGLQTAYHLLLTGYHVVLGCRNEQKGLNAVKYLNDECKKLGKKANVEYIHIDLSDLKSIHEFSNTIKRRNLELNLLINNAGIMFTKYHQTSDGFESHYGVNYLGHFCLTLELLPILLKRKSRILSLTSETHKWGKLNTNNIDGKYYHRWWSYCNSKLALIYFTNTIHQLLRKNNIYDVSIFAVNPGSVCTDIVRSTSKLIIWIYTSWLLKLILGLKTPREGSSSVVYSALSPDVLKYSGEYIDYTCEYLSKSENSRDEMIEKELFEISQELVGCKFEDAIKLS